MNTLETKKVSVPLAIGIIVMPVVFSWFTLRKGYSNLSRIISFAWMILGFISFAYLPTEAKHTTPEIKPVNSVVEKSSDKPVDSDQEALRLQQQLENRKTELADEDKPHFDWPKVDYTKAVAKVDLYDDQAIIKAVGKPVADQEKGTNVNGEPMRSYWFDKQPASGLQIDISREFIDIAWQFSAKDLEKSQATFNDGQKITRALLGGKNGSELYENISKGLKFSEITLDDGTQIKGARCGQFMCRYTVLR